MANEALRISNEFFAVTSQIERAPHWTMIRELTMNAIEAAARASGDKAVYWTSRKFEGARKAVLWNTGPGMGPAELKEATNLVCEIDKNLDLDENFGVGAKVSSLANNKHGVRFRSCKDGRVSEVILGYDADTAEYVRFERQVSNGAVDTVIDVTPSVIAEGNRVDFDWTEVMLLGNSAEQDTVARPFAGMSTEKLTWRRRFTVVSTGFQKGSASSSMPNIIVWTNPGALFPLATATISSRGPKAFPVPISASPFTISTILVLGTSQGSACHPAAHWEVPPRHAASSIRTRCTP